MGSACITSMAFPVPRTSERLLEDLMQEPGFLWLTTEEGEKIAALYVRRNTGRTILYSHGNAEDLSRSVQYLEVMATLLAADVLAYDYQGYGASEGEPSEDGCYDCAEAAFQYLMKNGVDAGRVVAFGRSLGSGPTVELVSRHPEIAGMVLQSALESGGRAVSFCGMGYMASVVCYEADIFRNYEKIGDIVCPVLFMHGTTDKVVPCHNSERLHAACQNAVEPLWIEGCGHNDMPYDVCLARARLFLDELERSWNAVPVVQALGNAGATASRAFPGFQHIPQVQFSTVSAVAQQQISYQPVAQAAQRVPYVASSPRITSSVLPLRKS